jgi:hypothetical protein
MSYQPVPTAVTNEVIPSSWWNTYVRDNMLALHEAVAGVIPSARVYNSADISIPNSTNTVLTFNNEHWDTDEMHSTVSNTGRLTCKTAGMYTIFTNIVFADNATGERVVNIRLNGSLMIASDRRPGHGSVNMLLSTPYNLNINDYLEVVVYQNRGGDLNVIRVSDYSPVFGMTYLGRV